MPISKNNPTVWPDQHPAPGPGGLWYEPGQTAAELGEFLILDKATLSGCWTGWTRRTGSERCGPEDGRIFKLYPSARANALKRS